MKSPLGEALAYIAKYRDGLGCFMFDGRVETDSNTPSHRYFVAIAGQRCAGTMRPIALNRKNALFAGHDLGAQNWAVIASLIETCKMNAVDPHAWITNTLIAIIKAFRLKPDSNIAA